MDPRPKSPAVTLPGAIIIGCAIIAIAIIWTQTPPPSNNQAAAGNLNTSGEINLVPVTGADHIFGNPNAPIKIVEYSDTSCPYCKAFHPVMIKLMAEYGPTGKVAWVYRHFPLDKDDGSGSILHPNAGTEAQAMECAAQIGGNDKFWEYTHKLYEITPAVTPQTPAGLDPKELPNIAKSVGLNVVSFNECLESGQFKDKVDQQFIDGLNAGVSGTPYSIIVTPTGGKIPLMGAQPYASVKAAIEALIGTVK